MISGGADPLNQESVVEIPVANAMHMYIDYKCFYDDGSFCSAI